MPYITKTARNALELGQEPQTVGELNYAITRILDRYLNNSVSYTHINDAVGVLECAKLELYRRVAVPYETQKEHDNGDVYTCLVE